MGPRVSPTMIASRCWRPFDRGGCSAWLTRPKAGRWTTRAARRTRTHWRTESPASGARRRSRARNEGARLDTNVLANRFSRGRCPSRQRFAQRRHGGPCCSGQNRPPWPQPGRMYQSGGSYRRTWGPDDRPIANLRRCCCRNDRRRRWNCRSCWGHGLVRHRCFSRFWLGLLRRNLGLRRLGRYFSRWCGGFRRFNHRLSFGLRLSYLDLGLSYRFSLRRLLLDLLSGEVILDVLNALSVNMTGGRDPFNPLAFEVGNNLQRFNFEVFR